MAAKALRYHRGGTTVVWIVWTEEQKVDVWRPGDHRPSSTLTAGDRLDGAQVGPGFVCPVSDILN